MKTSTTILALMAALSWAIYAREPMAVLATADDCGSGPVPVVWPLGPTGFDVQRIYDSHGQYLQIDTSAPYTHSGVDVAACPGDEVYAVVAGKVEFVQYETGKDSNLLIISDDDDPMSAWVYQHMDIIRVAKGDTVVRDQALGTIATFTAFTGFNHLHFERCVLTKAGGDWIGDRIGGGNPLNWLAARADPIAPRVLPLGAPTPAGVPFRFYKDGTGSTAALTTLVGSKVDVVACVNEIFPGLGAPVCSLTFCGTPVMSHQVMPARLTFSVFRPVEDPSGAGLPTTGLEVIYNNVIDLTQPNLTPTLTDDYLYREGTVADYEERRFLVNLTHCVEEGSGYWEVTDSGEYVLQLVLEDASGNATLREFTLELAP